MAGGPETFRGETPAGRGDWAGLSPRAAPLTVSLNIRDDGEVLGEYKGALKLRVPGATEVYLP